MHVHEKKWTDKKKSVDGCMSMNKSGRMHPKKKKKKNSGRMHQKKKKKKVDRCMSMNKSGRIQKKMWTR